MFLEYRVVQHFHYLYIELGYLSVEFVFLLFILVLQFSVPGNNILLTPELYISVLAYTSILNPETPQVSREDLDMMSYSLSSCWLTQEYMLDLV